MVLEYTALGHRTGHGPTGTGVRHHHPTAHLHKTQRGTSQNSDISYKTMYTNCSFKIKWKIILERYFKTENEERALQGSSQNPTDLQPVRHYRYLPL